MSIQYNPKVILNGTKVSDDPKEFDDPQVSDSLKVISNGSMDFNDKVNDKTKGISIESMDFDNPNVYGDTPIFDGLV